MRIRFNWIEENNLFDLTYKLNDYCYKNNVLDVQVFQNFAKYFDNLRTDGYVAIIKEQIDE